MKWTYKILRLFFCPHKYSIKLASGEVVAGGAVIGNYYNRECRYCHKIKAFRTY